MKPSNTTCPLPASGKGPRFESWVLIIFISILTTVVIVKEIDAQKIQQYHTERAPILPDAKAQVESLFKTWSALTPGLGLDPNNASALKWEGASSSLIGIKHLPAADITRFPRHTEHYPDRWVVYARSASGRFFSLAATWNYETRAPVLESVPRRLTQSEMIQIGIQMKWIEKMQTIGVDVDDA